MIFRLTLIGTLAVSVFTCCAKKEEPPAPPVAAQPEAVSPAAAAPAPNPGAAQVNVPSTPNPAAALSAADAALKAREYEQAVQAMLTIQQAQLTEQQAQAARNQMTRLQNDLAAAVARGDAKAKAAADLLRRSASGGR